MLSSTKKTPVRERFPLGETPWPTPDPFLFCVYHRDRYPAGNEKLGPQADLSKRQLGQDFTLQDGWRMYHGQEVPGFPGHPHCGFETLTVVTEGWVDHADSLNAAGRYGAGDVQWMTAGSGIQHSEMFPVLNPDGENPLELFQIWLNLPRKSKQATPCYKMFWNEDIPVVELTANNDSQTKVGQLTLIAGTLPENITTAKAPAPPPDSWANDPDHDVAVWLFELEPQGEWTLPAAHKDSHRFLYFFAGESLELAGETVKPQGFALQADREVSLKNGAAPARLLLLQGKPIQESVAQYGPFVGNTRADIVAAHEKYMKDQFGGWPWPNHEPVHGQQGRFARYPDGTEETRP